MTTLNAHVKGIEKAKQQLNILKLSPLQKKRLHQKLARKAEGFSKKHARQQRDLDGRAWEPRKKKKRKKMLSGLRSKIKASGTSDKASLFFKDQSTGVIAKAQQEGINQTVTAQQASKRSNKASADGPATRGQAKALKAEGFKRRKENGKGYKNCTLRWITENISQKQAGAILRSMRGNDSQSSWVIELPARSFLGTTQSEREKLTEFIFDDTTQQIKKR